MIRTSFRAVLLLLALILAAAPSSATNSRDSEAASGETLAAPGYPAGELPGTCLADSSANFGSQQQQHTRAEQPTKQPGTGWHQQAQRLALREALDSQLWVVLALDPCFGGDYEAVPVTGLTKAGLLPWVAGLTDALTVTDDGIRKGLPLKVDSSHKAYTQADCHTYAECVSDAIQRDDAARAAAVNATEHEGRQPVTIVLPTMMLVAYHMTQFSANVTTNAGSLNYSLPSERLRLTTVQSFYMAAEATAAANAGIDEAAWRAVSSWNTSTKQPVGTIAGLAGSVLVLPRWVTRTNDRYHKSITDLFGATSKWTPEFIHQMASHFVAALRVKTVPSLEEWWLNADKVWLNRQWHSEKGEDSQHAAQLLDLVPVEVPMNETEALRLCWSDQPLEEADVQATMKVIFDGLQTLHSIVKPNSTDRAIMTPEGPDTMQSYILKRTFSEGGRDILFFKFPTSVLLGSDSSTPWLATGLSTSGIKETSEESPAAENLPPLLDHVARHIMRRGCASKWLLQFQIKDFAITEYSVYLVGGAEADPHDAWLVYKPTLQNHNVSSTQLFLRCGTLDIPAGHFASELLPDWESDEIMRKTVAAAEDAAGELPPGPLRTDVSHSADNWRQSSWPSPKMYDAIVDVAIKGIKRFSSRRNKSGRLLMPALHKTFARLDLGVFLSWNETSSRHEAVVRVHEFGWVNDASMWGECWNTSSASLAAGVCSHNSHGGNNEFASSSRKIAWEESCSDATPQQLRDALVASQHTSLAVAYSKVLLRQVAWTALNVTH